MDIATGGCKSVFLSDESEIKEKFTKLWIQVIDEKENGINANSVVQTSVL